LVSPDERLEQFLDPSCDFDLPFVPPAVVQPANHPAEAPSRVEVAVRTLGQLESEVIAALFPPNGEPPATLEEISKELGMTVGEVRNIADEALRGLRGVRSGAQRISKAWN
jgi:DNA-directed RNA polymerase sigma subunit (sigma70/sigma32)